MQGDVTLNACYDFLEQQEEANVVTQHFFLLNGLKFQSNLTVDTYEEAMWCANQGLGITMAMKKTAEFFLKNQAVNLLVVPTKMASLVISTMVLKDASQDIIQVNEDIAKIFMK